MRLPRHHRIVALLAAIVLWQRGGERLLAVDLPRQMTLFEEAVPQEGSEFTAARVDRLIDSAADLHEWLVVEGLQPWSDEHAQSLRRVEVLCAAKRRVDELFQQVMNLRGDFAAMPAGEARREHARQFLRGASAMIDLSGRMRYVLRDIIDGAAYAVETDEASLAQLIAILQEQRSSIGAAVMAYLLHEPLDSSVPPAPLAVRLKLLEAIALTRESDLLPDLAAIMLSDQGEPAFRLAVAETIRTIGLPQDMRPQAEANLPRPVITAAGLHEKLMQLDRSRLSEAEAKRLDGLAAWSRQRAEKGIVGDSIRVAGFDLREGDWLLMRNPSPYNHFTDLAPGLFTHVGVVTAETSSDGRRRFVIVEMPEQSAHIPATNVDAYLLRTLHYFFLRHDDPAACRSMSAAAASMIGNESQFDLHFRTDRVTALAGQPLAGRPIHTYCAGFLLLCALQTEHPRESFFPLPEHAPNDNCQKNLAKLGLSIGDDFISPTGALFSPRMTIVAQRRPMYEPTREIKEAVYDHFAARVIHDELTPSPNAFQSFRERLARLSKQNEWLARALARANNVSEQLDLESAAKAAAVVETLDEIADGAMNDFMAARSAFLAGPAETLSQRGLSPEQIARVAAFRGRHAELWNAWVAHQLSPRGLRLALVEHYVAQGKERLDERFFHAVSE